MYPPVLQIMCRLLINNKRLEYYFSINPCFLNQIIGKRINPLSYLITYRNKAEYPGNYMHLDFYFSQHLFFKNRNSVCMIKFNKLFG